MDIEEALSNSSKSEAISMAIEIIEIEIYAQLLSLGIDPTTVPVDQIMDDNHFNASRDSATQAEWLAYTAVPRLVNRRLALINKLEEIQSA